jgi:mono/diheme cytochrome c family protein
LHRYTENPLNDPFTATTEFSSKITAVVLTLVIGATVVLLMGTHFQSADPYTEKVLSRVGNQLQGHAIFQINCATCHGLFADGKVGPSLRAVASRKSRSALIEQVTSGKTPPMPQFQPSPQEMADLLSYLESL